MIAPTLFYEPVQVHYGDIWQLGQNRLLCGNSTNAQDVERLLQGEKYDLCFADPPYGIGIDKWDVALEDVSGFIALVIQHLKSGGFFALTHQMPFMIEWLYVLRSSRLKYRDHISWIKRVHTAAACQLVRCHENLFIYCDGIQPYRSTKGPYTDVKLPGVLFDVVSIEGIDRHIKDLQLKVKQGMGSPQTDSIKRNSVYRYMGMQGDRSPEFVNFSNVWSFLPEHQRQKGNAADHATAKPLLLIQRLIELCTLDDALIYDVFLGSGTTIIASELLSGTRRVYGCEISPTYCEAIIHRWQEATAQQAKRVEVAP